MIDLPAVGGKSLAQGFEGSDNILADRVANNGWNLERMVIEIEVQAWAELMVKGGCA